MHAGAEPSASISARVVEFFALLRDAHGFSTGQAETQDALRALHLLGLSNPYRVRTVLRTVACGKYEQLAVFDAAYERFFLRRDGGLEQPRGPSSAVHLHVPGELRARAASGADLAQTTDEGAGTQLSRPRSHDNSEERSNLTAWLTMRARTSAIAAAGEAPRIEALNLDAMERAARLLVRSVHLGRARRWRPQPRGSRFDMRRTLRASLQTGGDPAVQHRLGMPRRAPRFVVLLDGSRSMSAAAAALLQFTFALSRATTRLRAYVFSTSLLDITRSLARAEPSGALEGLGEAWGGGTRLGVNLARFVRDNAPRVLDQQTLVIIASDGLDSGESVHLERAMRELRRRCARIVWLNPHARSPGFAPSSRGMSVATPFVDVLEALAGADDAERLALRLSRGDRRP